MKNNKIALATDSGRVLQIVDTTTNEQQEWNGEFPDIRAFTAEEDMMIITLGKQALNIKKGQLFLKSHCQRFYYIVTPKTTYFEVYTAWISHLELRRKEQDTLQKARAIHSGDCDFAEVPTCSN